MTRRGIGVLVAGFCALLPGLLKAQPTEQSTAADALFDEGKAQIAAGDISGGCAKLEKSHKLAQKLGVKLNLADCYDKLGRSASAWAQFREAASLAESKGDNRATFARERMAALEPKIVRVLISAPDPIPRGFSVTRDGQAVLPEVYGVAVPTDPGTYVIEATARGHAPFRQEVVVGEGQAGTTVRVDVPPLSPIAGFKDDPLRPMPVWLPWTVTAGGAVLLTVGIAVFAKGASTRSEYEDIRDMCVTPTPEQCSQLRAAEHLVGRSRTEKIVGVVGMVLGAGALATGVVLIIKNRPRSEQSLSLRISPGGLSLVGKF